MTNFVLKTKILLRKDNSTHWELYNPILEEGELGYETDTKKIKIGDGRTSWNDLPYLIEQPVPEEFDFTISRDDFVNLLTAQTIQGVKTFKDTVIFEGPIVIKNNDTNPLTKIGADNPSAISQINVPEDSNKLLIGPLSFDEINIDSNGTLKILT